MNEVIPINLGLVNAYLVKGKDKCILVDCGFPGQEKKILRRLAKNNVVKGDVGLIVITHGDIDHYGSSGALRQLLDAPVLIHKADGHIIRTGVNRKIPASNPIGFIMKCVALFLTALTKKRYRPFEPDVIMQEERFSLEAYGVDGFLLHTPGETGGSVSMILADGKVIAGDLIGGIVPRSGTPGYSPFSSDLSEVRKSLGRVLALDPSIIYTGHSSPIKVKKHFQRLRRLADKL